MENQYNIFVRGDHTLLLDLLDTNNLASYNIKLAHTIGLTSAIYVNQLISIQNKAMQKEKIDEDGYFVLSRTFITSQTTLSKQQQELIDNDLTNLKILSKKDNKLKLDLDVVGAIIANDDKKLDADLRSITKTSREAKATAKKEATKTTLKTNVTIHDPELTPALEEWIDICYDSGSKINKITVKKFIEDLNNYTKGDLDLALTLVKVASANCYTTLAWAISKYENEKSVQVRVTQNNVRSISTSDKPMEVEF